MIIVTRHLRVEAAPTWPPAAKRSAPHAPLMGVWTSSWLPIRSTHANRDHRALG